MSDILITGASGFIGRHLLQYLAGCGLTVRGVDVQPLDSRTELLDVADAEAFSAYLADRRPHAIVHAAAMKSLADCERSKPAMLQVNLLPAEVVRDYAARHKAKVVLVSSDIVFDGKSGDYDEASPPDNQTVLPQFIQQRLQRATPVFLSSRCISNPTAIELLCLLIGRVLERDAAGIFHTAGPDPVSRREFGDAVAAVCGASGTLIVEDQQPDSTDLRPKNVGLRIEQTYSKLDVDPDVWRLQAVLRNILIDRETPTIHLTEAQSL